MNSKYYYIVVLIGLLAASETCLFAENMQRSIIHGTSSLQFTDRERAELVKELDAMTVAVKGEYELEEGIFSDLSQSALKIFQASTGNREVSQQISEEEVVSVGHEVALQTRLEEECDIRARAACLLQEAGRHVLSSTGVRQVEYSRLLCPLPVYFSLRETREELSAAFHEALKRNNNHEVRLLIPLLAESFLASGARLGEEEASALIEAGRTSLTVSFGLPVRQLSAGSSDRIQPGTDSLPGMVPPVPKGSEPKGARAKHNCRHYQIYCDTSKVNLRDYSFTAEKQDIFQTVLYIWEDNPGAAGFIQFLHMSIPFLRARARVFPSRPVACFQFLSDPDVSQIFSINRQPLSSLNCTDAKRVMFFNTVTHRKRPLAQKFVMPVERVMPWQCKCPCSEAHPCMVTLVITRAIYSRCSGDEIETTHHTENRNYYITDSTIQETAHKGVLL